VVMRCPPRRTIRRLQTAGGGVHLLSNPLSAGPKFMDACDELGILAIVSNPGGSCGDETFIQRCIRMRGR